MGHHRHRGSHSAAFGVRPPHRREGLYARCDDLPCPPLDSKERVSPNQRDRFRSLRLGLERGDDKLINCTKKDTKK